MNSSTYFMCSKPPPSICCALDPMAIVSPDHQLAWRSPLLINLAWSNDYRAILREFLHGWYPLKSKWEKWFFHATCHSIRLVVQTLEIQLTTLRVREKLLTTYENPLHHSAHFLPFCYHVTWCDPSIYSLHLRNNMYATHLPISPVYPSLDLTSREKISAIHLPISLVRPSID